MLALVPQYRLPVSPPPSPPVPEPADDDLVRQARGRSRTAFEALVRRYQKPIFYLCLRYVRDRDEAADLAQRTFIRAFGKISELRGDGVFRTWLYRIGVNLALNHLRDHARFVDDEPTSESIPVEPVGADRIAAQEESIALRRAVARLPTKQRMTLELRIYEEMSFREIACALDTTEGAAKVNFHYAVRKLRALLAEKERDS